MSRELTRQEKAAIRSLVKRWCANYDKDAGCLPLDCECYMLTVERITETRPCPVCGRAFLPDGRQRYCSPVCAGAALREQKRAYMRRKRR